MSDKGVKAYNHILITPVCVMYKYFVLYVGQNVFVY